jgi:hypothetical protein
MNPTLVMASQNIESDVAVLKKILDSFEESAGYQDGYIFDEKGEMAAGWWFIEIHIKPDLMDKIIEGGPLENRKIRDDTDILEIIQDNLKQKGSTARIRLYRKKPFLVSWWKWLLK